MSRRRTTGFVFLLVLAMATIGFAQEATAPPPWSMNATIIEACSCPMFCQCYFAGEPAGHDHGDHGKQHFCKFNNAYRVNSGHYGETSLAGAKFWVAGDLGHNFASGKTDWAELTFDPAVTPEQRAGIAAAMGKLYPVEWQKFTVAKDKPVYWVADNESATAKLDNGKAAEVVLTRGPGMTNDPVVISNLRYWAAPRNDGFVLMPNKVEAYRVGEKPFEYRGTNGFMITFDINSND
jgi:hypothetical protein